ncbi:MAG: class I SAM-dependent methyltransferase [Phycisphaerae bacterium]
MTPARWDHSERYIRELFAPSGALEEVVARRAAAGGLPSIAVSSDTGRVLMMLAGLTNGGRGAARALELGTLAGYSACWIARGLSPDGRLITFEPNARHADVAEAVFGELGLAGRVELRRTAASEAEFQKLTGQFGPASFDIVFVDAIKTDYPLYFRCAAPLIRPGGIFTAHNALGSNSWWIDAAADAAGRADRDAVDRFNRQVAADARFDAVILPMHQGLLVARRRADG